MNPAAPGYIDKTARMVRAFLARTGWSQVQLANELAVDQPWISKLLQGRLREITDRVQNANKYVAEASENGPVPSELTDAVRGYISKGGDPASLAQLVWALAHAQTNGEQAAPDRRLA